jgi:hypothetical protein
MSGRSRIRLLGIVASLLMAGIGTANAVTGSGRPAAPAPLKPEPYGSYMLRTMATLAPTCGTGGVGPCNDPGYCCTYSNYQYKLEMTGRFVIGTSAAVYQGRLASDWSPGVEVEYEPINDLPVVGTDNGHYLRGACDLRGGGQVGFVTGQGKALSCTLKLDDGPWVTAYYQSVETDWGTSYSADNENEFEYASGKYIRGFHNLPNG